MKRLPFVERCKRVSGPGHGDNTSRSGLPFVAQLRQTLQTTRARQADPWRSPLERVRGKVGDDGIERISTQSIFDMLDVAQRSRGAGACRRLAKLMRELGWAPIKARGNAAAFGIRCAVMRVTCAVRHSRNAHQITAPQRCYNSVKCYLQSNRVRLGPLLFGEVVWRSSSACPAKPQHHNTIAAPSASSSAATWCGDEMILW